MWWLEEHPKVAYTFQRDIKMAESTLATWLDLKMKKNEHTYWAVINWAPQSRGAWTFELQRQLMSTNNTT